MKKITSVIIVLIITLSNILPGMNVMAAYATLPTISASTSNHTVLLKNNGEVWTCGQNSSSQLGDGTTVNRSTPIKVNISDVIQVVSGHTYTVALKNNGEVWTWGNGSAIPVKVGISNVKQVAAGYSHTLALKDNGEVWAWGSNNDGELGNGTTESSKTPVKVNISDVKQLTAGEHFTIALKNNGEVWGWGNNGNGQLGDESFKPHYTPIKIDISNVKQVSAGAEHVTALKNNGEVWEWGFDWVQTERVYEPEQVNISNVKQVSAGGLHTAALKNNGEVWGWGNNCFNVIECTSNNPVKLNISNVSQIISSFGHITAIKKNGDVWTWGLNHDGRLGLGHTSDVSYPVCSGFNIYSTVDSKPSTVKKSVTIEVRDSETNKLIPDAEISLFNRADDVKNYNLPKGKKTLTNVDFPIYEMRVYADNYYYKPSDLNVPYPDDGKLVIHLNPKNSRNEVQAINIVNAVDNLMIGSSYQLQAIVTPDNSVDREITWSSSNSSVLSVNNSGLVFAKKIGYATITATASNGKSATALIDVLNMSDYYFNFSYIFDNVYSDFYGDIKGYKIPYARYLQVGFKPLTAKIMSFTKWEGNCFGMSSSSILFWKDVLKEENYDRNVSFPFKFSKPKNNEKLRNMIELFQVSQYIEGYDNYEFFNNIELVTEQLDSGNPVMLKMKGVKISDNSTGYHAVVITGYEKINQLYKFKIYDCARFVSELLYVNNDEWVFDYNIASYSFTPEAFYTCDKIYEVYNAIRYCNYNDAISLFSLEEKPTYTYLFAPAMDMEITNSAGQNIRIKDGNLTTDIEDVKLVPSSYLSEEPTYTVIMPADTYTIIGSSDESADIALADDNMSVDITANSSTPITVSSDLHDINIGSESEADYSVTYTTYDNVFDEMTISGTTYSPVKTSLNDTNINVSGAKSITAKATRSDVPTEVSTEIEKDKTAVIECFENEIGNTTLQIKSDETSLTETASLPERVKADAPQYDLAGGTYSEAQTLTFTYDDDTVVYYTTDGSVPSEDNGAIYSLPIDINQTIVINAVAVKYGYENSDVITLEYVLPEVSVPTASLKSGNYTGIQQVELLSKDGAEIYYTTDESDPSEYGILYNFPIILTQNTTIKVYAKINGCVSDVVEYNYKISNAQKCIIQSITAADELVKVNIISDKTESGVLVLACYKDDGTLLNVKLCDAELTANEPVSKVIEMTTTEAAKISAFLLDDLSSLIPLAQKKSIEITDQ